MLIYQKVYIGVWLVYDFSRRSRRELTDGRAFPRWGIKSMAKGHYGFFTNYTNWVNVYIANWRITIFTFGKSTISIRAMFQFANCHSHYQRLYQLSNWSWWIIPSYKKHRHVGQKLYTRWTYSELIFIYIHSWLVVWNMAFIFPKSWDDDPIWLIFFRGLETTN